MLSLALLLLPLSLNTLGVGAGTLTCVWPSLLAESGYRLSADRALPHCCRLHRVSCLLGADSNSHPDYSLSRSLENVVFDFPTSVFQEGVLEGRGC